LPARSIEETTSVTPFFSSVPPSLFGLQTSASSKREAGGKPRPFACGTSPVALHTAVISMPDLVPSMNELNIFGLMWLRSLIFRYCRGSPTPYPGWSGGRSGGSACLCRRDDPEPAGPRPVDVLANQRRLVAPRQRVDDSGLSALPRQQRSGQGIGLDVDHDDMLAVRNRRLAQLDAGSGIARRLDHHVDLGMADQRHGVDR
jgi:hypothetical protein